MTLKLHADLPQSSTKHTTIVGVASKGDTFVLPQHFKQLKPVLDRLHKSEAFTGGFKSTYFFPIVPAEVSAVFKSTGGLLLIGLGELASDQAERSEQLRRLGAVITKTMNSLHLEDGAVDCRSFSSKGTEAAALCIAEGAALSHYTFQQFKKKPKKLSLQNLTLITGSKKKLQSELNEISLVIEGTHFARNLGNLPGNELTPAALAKKAEELAKKFSLSATILDKKEIIKEKLNLLLAVGQGTANDPRLIVLEYNKSKKNAPHLCLVGKGLTFDSGGISIKPAGGMEEMKFDMCGSAAVLGAMYAIAALKLPLRVTVVVPTAENMSGDEAIRPGDIFISHKGLSVEITNTDAEGRLVLADAISYVQKYIKPDAIVDAATLTGACVIALGGTHSGAMGNNDKLMDLVKKASKLSGEAIWELPLSPFYEEDMDSPYADVRNSGNVRGAGSSKGGIFLRRFVEKDMPWVHLDIAGTAYNAGHFDYNPKSGASGVMVRLFTTLARNFKKI